MRPAPNYSAWLLAQFPVVVPELAMLPMRGAWHGCMRPSASVACCPRCSAVAMCTPMSTSRLPRWRRSMLAPLPSRRRHRRGSSKAPTPSEAWCPLRFSATRRCCCFGFSRGPDAAVATTATATTTRRWRLARQGSGEMVLSCSGCGHASSALQSTGPSEASAGRTRSRRGARLRR